MGWNYTSIPKPLRLHLWSLGMDKYFHPTLCNGYHRFPMLWLGLIYVKWDPGNKTQAQQTATKSCAYFWGHPLCVFVVIKYLKPLISHGPGRSARYMCFQSSRCYQGLNIMMIITRQTYMYNKVIAVLYKTKTKMNQPKVNVFSY